MDLKVQKRGVALILFLGLLLTGMVLAASSPAAPLGTAHVRSIDEAAAFLAAWGWECITEQGESKETVLPTEFDETFIAYNSIQLKQGCDLTKYAGKTVTVYSIPISNYNSTENVWGTLIVFRSTVIGGDIHSASMDGFLHGLKAE